MNTKFSILVFFIFLFIPVLTFGAKSIHKEETRVTKAAEPVKAKTVNNQSIQLTNELPSPWHKADIGKTSIPHPDEDGKKHYFHFNRLEKRRFRYFLLIVSRLFLIIIHLASLLFGYMSCLH